MFTTIDMHKHNLQQIKVKMLSINSVSQDNIIELTENLNNVTTVMFIRMYDKFICYLKTIQLRNVVQYAIVLFDRKIKKLDSFAY